MSARVINHNSMNHLMGLFIEDHAILENRAKFKWTRMRIVGFPLQICHIFKIKSNNKANKMLLCFRHIQD